LAMEAVHLGEELVHHRMLDAGALVRPARGGERIELVEHDDRRRRLASAMKDLAKILLALADPLALELGPRDDRDCRPDTGRHRLGEERLAGAGRAPEDHAARDQLLDPLDVLLARLRFLEEQDVENLGAEPLLDLLVAAEVVLEVDVRDLERRAEGRLPNL